MIGARDSTLSVNAKAWANLVVVTVIIGLLLFVPAGTIHYWQAWVYLGIYFIASFFDYFLPDQT